MAQQDVSSVQVGPRTATSIVRVRVGALDAHQARELKLVLYDLAVRPRSRVVVDVSELDDRHELTLFKLLTETNRRLRDPESHLVVANPSPRLSTYLRAAGIAPAPELTVPLDRPCDLRLDFGTLEHVACVHYSGTGAHPLGHIPFQRGEGSPCAFAAQCGAPSAMLELTGGEGEQ